VDLEREDNEHIGYSSGIHLCFGGPLARLEVQIAVGEFVRRVKNPQLMVDPPPIGTTKYSVDRAISWSTLMGFANEQANRCASI